MYTLVQEFSLLLILPDLECLKELRLSLGQVAVGQHGQQVAKVVSWMEGEPLDIVQENNPCNHNSDLRDI